MRSIEIRRHTMRSKPGQHLTQAGVDLARWVGMRIGPFDHVVTSTIPRAFETALAMGFAIDEQQDLFARMPDEVEAEVHWPSSFEAWGAAVRKGGATTAFGKKLSDAVCTIIKNLPEGGTALLINHGGIVEACAVGCMPDANHAAWGDYIRYCEGIRLEYEGIRCVSAQILRVPLAPET